MHEAKLSKMEAEMKMVFQQKVQEKEAKLKQSEEELYARHKEMRDALEKQRSDLEEKKRRLESGRPLTPEKGSVCFFLLNKLLSRYSCFIPRPRGRRVSSVRKTAAATNFTSPFRFAFLLALEPDVDNTCAPTSRGDCLHCISSAILSSFIRLILIPREHCHARYSGYPRFRATSRFSTFSSF